MMKRIWSVVMIFMILISHSACGGQDPNEIELDLDTISDALTASGHFPNSLEALDAGLVAGQLSLYEDRIEASPEDLLDARYSMALGLLADQFILLEGIDPEAADRLEQALHTYAEDQRSSFEFYDPGQAARFDAPIIARQGNYLLFAVGTNQDKLSDLCTRLMNGEDAALDITGQEQISEPPKPAIQRPETEGSAFISPADTEAARLAALDYYAGTVFEVDTLTEINQLNGWEGEIMFQVTCSKGGVPQVDRTIALERQDGVWTVTGEGY